MKLWQKIFLISLCFMIVISLGSSALILSMNFRMIIEREQLQAVSVHESLSAGIANHVVVERIKSDKVLLPADEVASVLETTVYAQPNDANGIAIIYGEETIISVRMDMLGEASGFIEEVQGADGFTAVIMDYGDSTVILTGSEISLEGVVYVILTSADITGVYDNYYELQRFVQVVSVISAIILAGVLLFVILFFLRPLAAINKTLGEIAQGNYALRLRERGGREFKELAENINTMSGAIQAHVDRIQAIADGRKQFADSLAHEMKTPLTSILGFADILRVKRNIDDRHRMEYAGIIVEEARRLKSLSGKLLELAVTQGLTADFEQVNLKDTLYEVAASMLPLLTRKKLTLKYITSAEGLAVAADKMLLKSLFYNILENAVKASPGGHEIRVDVKKAGGRVVVSISDDGVGMSRDDVRKATEPFYMADRSRSRKAGGVGLGLALCAEIARLHDAPLCIESILGTGTCVSMAFPDKGGVPHEL